MQRVSNKITSLKPYLFSEFHKRKLELMSQGVDVIDLGIGAPDLPTPTFIIEKLIKEVGNSSNHKYSPYNGIEEFRNAVAAFYKRRYNVELNPINEIIALIGSKEGIAHFTQAVMNENDLAIIPDPGYPVYQSAVHLAGGIQASLPLDANQNFVPQFHKLSKEIYKKARLMFLNYPSNPTAGTVDLSVFEKAVSLAKKHQFTLIQDSAYDLMTFGDYKAPSIFQVKGAKDVAIEFGSLSKSFNMTGWRIGYAVGNSELIKALSTLKSNIDTCQFIPIQKAAAVALNSDLSEVKKNNLIFEERMRKMVDILTDMGFHVNRPRATFYLWVKVPSSYTSLPFAEKLLNELGIIVTPGIAFGNNGEGYFRISLTVGMERILEVEKRLKSLNF